MTTVILMGVFLVVLLFVTLFGVKYDKNKTEFFSYDDTKILKGFWCIIIVLVHVPADFQNKIQDSLGSFAYIGVTFFFMASAYGLKYSVKHKQNYLRNFWKRRLPALIIPALLVNLVSVAMRLIFKQDVSPWSIFAINPWVLVLVLLYFVFWMIYYVSTKLKLTIGIKQDVIICLITIAFSIVDKLTSIKITSIWPTECWGFVYGILLADFSERIRAIMNKNWILKTSATCVLSALFGILYLKFKSVYFIGDYCLKILLGMLISAFILQFTIRFKLGNTAIRFLGNISYEVYLMHFVIFYALGHINIQMNSGLYIWVALVLTIISSLIIQKISSAINKRVSNLLIRPNKKE